MSVEYRNQRAISFTWNSRDCRNWAASGVTCISFHLAPPERTAGLWALRDGTRISLS